MGWDTLVAELGNVSKWACEHGCEHGIGWAWQQTAANSIPQEEMGWGDGLSGGSEKSRGN